MPDGIDPALLPTLRAAAVAGRTFDRELLSAAYGAGRPDPAGLVAAGLLQEDGEGNWRHTDVALLEAVYEDAAPGWKASAHARVAAELARRGAPARWQAHHAERSAGADPAAAVRVFTAAADETGRDRMDVIAHWLAAAVRLLPHADVGEAFAWDLRIRHAWALGLVGRAPEARALLQGLLTEVPAGTPRRIQVAALASQMDCLIGRCLEGQALARGELAAVTPASADAEPAPELTVGLTATSGAGPREPVTDGGPALVLTVAAVCCALIADRRTDQRERLARSLEAASLSGNTYLTTLRALRVLADRAAGKVTADTYDLLSQAASTIDGWSDDDFFVTPETALFVGWAERRLHRNRAAVRHLAKALHLLRERLVHSYLTPYYALELAGALTSVGRLADAEEVAALAAETARDLGGAEVLTLCVARQSLIAAWRGNAAQARRLAEEASGLAFDRSGWMSPIAAATTARALLHAGDPRACVDLLSELGGASGLEEFDPYTRTDVLALLAEALWRSGRTDEAVTAAETALAHSEQLGPAAAGGPAHLALSQATGGTHHAALAAERFANAEDPIGEGRAWHAAGAPDRAAALFEASGARLFAQELARSRPPANLTPRQRRIADLAANGRSNREIAKALHVSPATIEKELTRIYAARGVSSRTALTTRHTPAEPPPFRGHPI